MLITRFFARSRRWIGLFFGLLICLGLSVSPAQGQKDGSWSEPTLLFRDNGRMGVQSVAADQAGNVHAFWSFQSRASAESGQNGQISIYYSMGNGVNWSAPIDIISAVMAAAPSAAVDGYGQLHLLWVGPQNALFYSTAPINQARSARSWKTIPLADSAAFNTNIVVDHQNRIHVLYATRDSAGVFYTRSTDSGHSWTKPVNVSHTVGSTIADYPHLSIAPNGALHVVWTEFLLPDGWPPNGIYYSRSEDGGQNWSAPQQIAGHGYTQVNVAAVNDGEIHVAWNGMSGIQGRYHRWSTDGGKNWSDVVTLNTPKLGGSEGPPQLSVDASGVMHLITSDAGCIWYTTWQDQQFDTPVCIAKSTMLEAPVMTLAMGNHLYVVYHPDLTPIQEIWYTSRLTNAVENQVIPFALPSPDAAATLTEKAPTPIAATPTPPVVIPPSFQTQSAQPADPGLVILAGLAPILVLLAIFFLLRAWQWRAH